jgi:poly(A)-specific ribonuclease
MNNKKSDVLILKKEEIEKTNNVLKDVELWLNKKEETSPFIINEPSSFLRKFYYQKIEAEFKNCVAKSLEDRGGIEITKFNCKEDRDKYDEEVKRLHELKLEQIKGFTRIFEIITEHKKPFIGHNLLFDLLFLQSHFDYLEQEYKHFKTRLHTLLPEIYDTKYIASNTSIQTLFLEGTSLGTIHRYLHEDKKSTQQIKLKYPPGFDVYTVEDPLNLNNSPKYHEAGFDALVTGYVFLKMKSAISEEELNSTKNKLNTMFSLFDINLGANKDFKKKKVILIWTYFINPV